MLRVVMVLLALWLALVVVGWVVKGLFWLAVAGLLFFLVTLVFGARHRGPR